MYRLVERDGKELRGLAWDRRVKRLDHLEDDLDRYKCFESKIKASNKRSWILILMILFVSFVVNVYVGLVILAIFIFLLIKTDIIREASIEVISSRLYIDNRESLMVWRLYEFNSDSLRSVRIEQDEKRININIKMDETDSLYDTGNIIIHGVEKSSTLAFIHNIEKLLHAEKLNDVTIYGKEHLVGNGFNVTKFLGNVFLILIVVVFVGGIWFSNYPQDCQVLSTKVSPNIYKINGVPDAGVDVNTVVVNKGKKGDVVIIAQLSTSQGVLKKKKEIYLEKDEQRKVLFQFPEPSFDAKNIKAGVTCR